MDLEGSKWAGEVSNFFRKTIEQSSQSNRAEGLDPKSLEAIYRRWGEFLNEELPEDQAESLKLQRGLLFGSKLKHSGSSNALGEHYSGRRFFL